MEKQDFILRKIRKEDNEKVAKMIRDVFEEYGAPKIGTVYSDPTTDALFELFQFTEKSHFFIAEYQQEIVGCCGIYPTDHLPLGYVELVKYYIHKSARGKGLGTLLFEGSLKAAKEEGYQYLYLESLPIYAKAVSIYERLGFKRISTPLGNSGHTSCDIWMEYSIYDGN